MKVWCMRGGHFIDEDKITYLVSKGVRKRMCEDCKAKQLDRIKKETAALRKKLEKK